MVAKALPLVSLETRADRWLLGTYFALMVYLIVPAAALFHEGAHALGYLLAGYPVRGVFISPFMSQVLGLYPVGLSPQQGWISAAGPLGGLLFGYLAAWLCLGKRRSWGLWGDTALVMATWVLMVEPGYLINGSLANFGDPQQVAVHLGISRWVVFAVGVVLVLANARLIQRAFARWMDTFAPGADRRRLRPVLGVFILVMVLISIPYWIPIMSYVGR